MKYNAPVSDYIQKSTFEIEDFFAPVRTKNQVTTPGGVKIDITNTDTYILGIIKSDLYILNSINLCVNTPSYKTNMKIQLETFSGLENTSYTLHYNWIETFNIPVLELNSILYIDVTTLFTGLNPNAHISMGCYYSAVQTPTSIKIMGLLLKYKFA